MQCATGSIYPSFVCIKPEGEGEYGVCCTKKSLLFCGLEVNCLSE